MVFKGSGVRSAARAVVLAALLAGGGAAADKAPDAATRKQVKALVQAGASHYAAGDFERAIADYEAAYRLAPLPGFFYNLAQAHRQLGHRGEALDNYRRYVAAVPSGAASDEARSFIASLSREPGPPPPERPADPTPAPRLSSPPVDDPGLAAQDAASPPDARTAPVDAGAPPPDRAAPAIASSVADGGAPHAVPVLVAATPPREEKPRPTRWWIGAAVGGAVVVGGAVLLGVLLGRSPGEEDPFVGTLSPGVQRIQP